MDHCVAGQCMPTAAEEVHAIAGSNRVTFPPRFIPSTAVERAGGGFGPLLPEKSPPALSDIFLTGWADTGSPAMNSKGCTGEATMSVFFCR